MKRHEQANLLIHLHHWHPEIPASSYAIRRDEQLSRFHGTLHARHEDRSVRLQIRHEPGDISTKRAPEGEKPPSESPSKALKV